MFNKYTPSFCIYNICIILAYLLSPSLAIYLPNINFVQQRSEENNNTNIIDTDAYKVDSSLIPGFNNSWNDILTMNAGHIPVTEANSALYFWNFKSINQSLGTSITNIRTNKRPLIIWLNGGPGCSSMDGALMEVGPLRVHEFDSIVWNEGWFNVADLLFIDQPIGTGFSYKIGDDDLDSNLVESSNHLFTFINNYFNIFKSDYDHYDSIIIAGESYAGQYIPHLARLLKDSDRFSNKLKAILLGNAWLDPNLQSLSYIPFAINNGLIDPNDETTNRHFNRLLNYEEKCQNLRNNHDKEIKFEEDDCEAILLKLLNYFRPKQNQCINVYDIKKSDSYPACGNNWPEILPQATSFLNNEQVQKAINVLSSDQIENTWQECSRDVGNHYSPPSTAINGAKLLQGLLNDGIKVNLFSGINDMICNYLSTEMVIKEHLTKYLESNNYQIILDKDKQNEFKMDSIWKHDDKQVGSFWKRGNLTYIKVNDASHMVAYDVSKPSIGLIDLSLRDDIDGDDGKEVETFSDEETKTKIENNAIEKEKEHEKEQEENEKEKEKENGGEEKKSSPKKYLALFILIIVLAILAIYFFRVSTRKPSRYSALAGAHNSSNYGRFAYEWVSGTGSNRKGKGKKKRVHWIDLEELDDEMGENDDNNLNNNNSNNLEGQVQSELDLQLENDEHLKSFEMEDLDLESGMDHDNDDIQRPREGSFESEEQSK